MGKDAHDDGACCYACERFAGHEALARSAAVLEIPSPRRIRIVVRRRGGETSEFTPTSETVSIGRVAGNDIVLSDGAISRRQAKITLRDGVASVTDLRSACGTFVDGRKITAPTPVREGSVISAGDFDLRIVVD